MPDHDLRAVAFPKLEEAQVAELASCANAQLKKFRAGQKLFEIGDRDIEFFIVKCGEVEIVDESGDTPKTVAIHRAGEFTGTAAHLSGRSTPVSAVARIDTEVYAMPGDAVKNILNGCPKLSDIILHAFIARRQLLRESDDFVGLRVIGSRYSHDTFRVRDFLARNRMLFTWLDLENDPHVKTILQQFGFSEADTPVVAFGHKLVLRNPSNREIADALGLRRPLEKAVYDLVVVGAGPAGLAAAVYGASEGLSTVVLESTAPGGQAGRSMRIENYLGFPTGITGVELAERAVIQASKFGAQLPVASPVISLTFENIYPVVHLEGDEIVTAKCLIIATGADYRQLGVERCTEFEGCGVYYAATPNEAQICKGQDVIVVGGGNSAGQAAVYVSSFAGKVYLVIRGDNLYKNMSSYLAHRIEDVSNIEVLLNSEIRKMSGGNHLDAVEIVNKNTGQVRTVKTPAVFSFIGAKPRTEWLPLEIEKDPKNFIRTGPAVMNSPYWKNSRQPFLLETSRPGVFAAGDVRSESVKRVASAVGEGAMAVQFVHEYLKYM